MTIFFEARLATKLVYSHLLNHYDKINYNNKGGLFSAITLIFFLASKIMMPKIFENFELPANYFHPDFKSSQLQIFPVLKL